MNKRILVVVAHPDDEILGCGGTIAKLVSEGADVALLILGEGVTSRDIPDCDKRISELKALKKEVYSANKKIGVKRIFIESFSDNRFDTIPLLDIIKVIESVKDTVKPDIIFTHFENDLNIDHKITAQAVFTATRPMPNETVKEIYSFEVLSSTEWNYPISFKPNYYVDISTTLLHKKNAMEVYENEIRDFPHPRSLEGIELNAAYWGMRIGVKFAEVFQVMRILR